MVAIQGWANPPICLCNRRPMSATDGCLRQVPLQRTPRCNIFGQTMAMAGFSPPFEAILGGGMAENIDGFSASAAFFPNRQLGNRLVLEHQNGSQVPGESPEMLQIECWNFPLKIGGMKVSKRMAGPTNSTGENGKLRAIQQSWVDQTFAMLDRLHREHGKSRLWEDEKWNWKMTRFMYNRFAQGFSRP